MIKILILWGIGFSIAFPLFLILCKSAKNADNSMKEL